LKKKENLKLFENFLKTFLKNASKNFKPIVLTTNNQGAINSITGSPELLKQMEQSYSGSFQLNKTFTQFLNIKSTKNIGDSWIDSNTYAGNSMIINTHMIGMKMAMPF
jgi:hypothetical protein